MYDDILIIVYHLVFFRAERTDRFKSERFAEDRSALTSSRRNDREFRSNRVGRSAATRDGRRQGSYRERRYDRRAEDYDMSKVTEKLTNPTYVPKDGRYFLVSGCTKYDAIY